MNKIILQTLSSVEIDRGNEVEKMCRSGIVIELNDTKGEILSPGYMVGKKYPENLNCSWLIEAPPGKVITFIFIVSYSRILSHHYGNLLI